MPLSLYSNKFLQESSVSFVDTVPTPESCWCGVVGLLGLPQLLQLRSGWSRVLWIGRAEHHCTAVSSSVPKGGCPQAPRPGLI